MPCAPPRRRRTGCRSSPRISSSSPGPTRGACRSGPSAVPVDELFATVAERFERRAHEHGRAVEARLTTAAVEADPRASSRRSANLVENALTTGRATIDLYAIERDDVVELHVTDGGRRLPGRFLGRAFDRFSRADEARGEGGSGLGLSIVALIAQAHGGSAGAANRPEGAPTSGSRCPARAQQNPSAPSSDVHVALLHFDRACRRPPRPRLPPPRQRAAPAPADDDGRARRGGRARRRLRRPRGARAAGTPQRQRQRHHDRDHRAEARVPRTCDAAAARPAAERGVAASSPPRRPRRRRRRPSSSREGRERDIQCARDDRRRRGAEPRSRKGCMRGSRARARRDRPCVQPLPSRQRAHARQCAARTGASRSARCWSKRCAVALDAARSSGGLVDPTVGRALRVAGYDATFRVVAARDGDTFRAAFCTVPGWQTVELDERRARPCAFRQASSSISGRRRKRSRATARHAQRPPSRAAALVALGGDIAVAGETPAGGWPVRIADDHAAPLDSPGPTVALGERRPRDVLDDGAALAQRLDRAAPSRRSAHRAPRRVAVANRERRGRTCVDANVASTAVVPRRRRARVARRAPASRAARQHRAARARLVAGWPEERA